MNREKETSPLSDEATGQNRRGSLSVRNVNLFFLCYVVISLSLGAIKIPGLPSTWIPLIYYIPVVIVALLFCRKDGIGFGAAFGFHSVKPLTILLTVVICIGMHSVSHLVSSLTNLLIPSFLEAAGSSLLGGNFLVDFIGVAIIPAFFEELIVRGGLFNSYMHTGRLRTAVLLTAFLFGLIHMNVTQMFYSFVMGIALAMLFVLSGSIWPGILFHFLNNGMTPVAGLLGERYGDEFVGRYIFPFSRGLSDMKSAIVTVTAAVIGLIITILCLRGIARCEGSEERLHLYVRSNGGKKRLITLPLIIAMVLLLGMTAMVTYIMIMHLTPA